MHPEIPKCIGLYVNFGNTRQTTKAMPAPVYCLTTSRHYDQAVL